MITIRYANLSDNDFWFKLDKHLSIHEFSNKVKLKQCYILLENDSPIGILRYNLFWDNIPFCTMLYISDNYQSKGYGSKLLTHWENEMKNNGYDLVLTSTQVDEQAQHFYRKLGYKDCGGILFNIPNHAQPMELFLFKSLN